MDDVITQPDIMRSLCFATLLALNELDPEDDFERIAELPSIDARLYYEYKDQKMPMTYGPFGIIMVPGIVAEYGTAPNFRGNTTCPVIVSIARLIRDGSHERELQNLAILGQRIKPLFFDRKQCPVYLFAEDDVPSVGIVSQIDWHDEKLQYPPPTEKTVGNISSGQGVRWLRYEISFTIFYRIDVTGGF